MKKIVFITLLCFSVAAIAVTSGHSQQSSITTAGFSNIVDTTTPKMHHVMVKKTVHDKTHKAVAKSKTKTKKPTKSAKDSSSKK